MYECPNCAGNLKFDIQRQMLYCEHCDTSVDPYSVEKERDAEEHNSEEYEATVFTCPQCGGEILSEDTTAATFCSFCGSATILTSRVIKERRPDYIIPFSKTGEDCRTAYAKMMSRAFFAPKELKDAKHIEKFRGIYMPYWVYNFEKKGNVIFGGRKTRRRGDYVITKHYRMNCDVEEEYKGISYDASASFSDNLSGAIAPFQMQEGKAFTPAFLSGFYADTSDVDKMVYKEEAQELVTEDAYRQISRDSVCKKYNAGADSLRDAVKPSGVDIKLAMLPVWFLSYRKGDRVSYAVVNGQTGKAAADIPIDPWKYLAGSALLAVPLFFLLNLFLTITPGSIMMWAIFLAVLSMVISNSQFSAIYERETGENDKGLQSKRFTSQNGGVLPGKDVCKSKRDARILRIVLMCLFCFVVLPGMSFLLPVIFLFVGMTPAGTGLFKHFANMGSSSGITLLLLLSALIVFLLRSRTRRKKYKVPFKKKFPTLVKPLAGIVASLVIAIINPVSDLFYYLGAFVCMATVLWAFIDIIKHHNILTTRKLPQFNRRGGDENA